jgi:signal transduction histidine kinase
VTDRGSLDLPLRLRRAGAGLAYLLVSVPLGIVSAVAVLVLALGAALSVVWIGIPLVYAAVAVCRGLAERDRRAANRLLDAHIPPLAPPADPRVRRSPVDMLSDRPLTRMLTALSIKLPIAIVALVVAGAYLFAAGGLLVLGVKGITGLGTATYVGPARTGLLTGIVLCLLSAPVAVLGIATVAGIGSTLRSITRALLLAPPTTAGGPVREMLAESLGDRTLSIAYWLPDREIFVDDAGHPVELPAAGSRRAWTAVERDGRRVAAIIHAAELDTGPELVQAAAAAAALALDNERLKADLRARVEELRVSRMRIVEAADAARRRLERDLHDGAQQHLVSLALDLRVLKARLNDPKADPLIDEIGEKLATGLAELRELARGIHPAVLTQRGLGPALEMLAERMPIPVECRVDVGEERLPPPIEAAAYFVVSEGLTNVSRYSQASRVEVSIRRAGDELAVDVHDDGVGGADMAAGSGLRGLADRIAALDGTLRVHSPPGGGTRLEARIPAQAAALAEAAREADPAPAPPPPQATLETPR